MKKIVAGNWKMNLGISDSIELTNSLLKGLEDDSAVSVWVAPSSQALTTVAELTKDSAIAVGAQNVHWEDAGAFTGELSVPMLKECGCTFALTGHSERRHVFGETNEIVSKRTIGALERGLTTVLCIGEKLEERESGATNTVLEQQLKDVVSNVKKKQIELLIIAYEPVWAIGTGKVATEQEIEAAHSFIAEYIAEHLDGAVVPILYGGSVNPDNFAGIITVANVGGALVGGASLSAEKFLKLASIAAAAS